MKPGIRVVRGPDWLLGNQDGGPGFLGTVVKFYPDNRVLVRWDVGTETECRAGKEDAYDLRIYDDAQIGVKHNIICDACDAQTLWGFRWKCQVCRDRDLCTDCYMADKCEPQHPHVRYTTPHALVTRIQPRRRSKAIPLYGIFPGAEVTNIGSSGTEESAKKIGVVKELVDLEPDGYRGAVKVEWKTVAEGEEGKCETRTYRVGAEGKVELRLVKPAAHGSVYLDHLPLLDLTMPVDVEFNEGDRVRIDLNLETFRPLMTEYGGWVEDLEKALGEEGRIQRVLDPDRRMCRVDFEKLGKNFALYMNVLTKIDKISAGDIVKVIESEDKIKRLQVGHGGWQNTDRAILGEVGKVVRIDDSRDAIVQINRKTFILNPSCLVWLDKAEDSANVETDSASQKSVPKAARRIKLASGVTVGVGMRVVRGQDWSPDFLDQDGGEGHLGSVVEICGLGVDNSVYPKQCVVVQWDNGEKNVYRAGYERAFDLRVYDNAGLGVKHERACSECKIEKVFGIRWQCTQCPDVILCSECYAGDRHDIQHEFLRFDTAEDDIGCKVPKRNMSKKVAAWGIFEKSKVNRGPDWRWLNQDGGEERRGEVIALVNFSPDTDRDAAEVTWENGYTNVYRLGYKGRLDVKCVGPVAGGAYYRDHLPILKLDADLSNAGAQRQVNGTESASGTSHAASSAPGDGEKGGDGGGEESESRFQEGDKVKIEMDPDLLKLVEQNRGAWNEQMTECIGKTGRVIVSKGSDITVDFESAGKWTFHESVLNKLKEFVPGQTVQVLESVPNVKMLQAGDWNDLMVEVVGQQGRVEEIDEDGDIKVTFNSGVSWVFNPECLIIDDGRAPMTTAAADQPQQRDAAPDQRAKTEEEKLQDLFQAIFSGSVDSVNTIVRTDPQLVLMDLKGRFAVHLACNEGKIGVLETLFKHSSKNVLLELPDPEKNTPLLAAVKGEQVDMVRYLVGQGADKNAKDQGERTAVHMAVASNNVEMLRQLRDLRFDINKKDMLQQSAIFDAIVSGNEEMIAAVMDWPEIDIAYEDSIGFTPFCIACRRGNLSAVCRIMEMAPDQLNRPKQDGCTGLHMAALNNHKDVVHFLLQQTGIQIDAVTAAEQRTALHMACHEGYTDIAKLLIDNGAKKDAVDSSGKTCLHLCFEVPPEKVNDPEKSDESIQGLAEYLLQSGVPHLVKDGDGKLAEDCVKSGLKPAVTELIKKWGQTQEKQEQKKPDGGRGERRGSDPGSKVPSVTPEPPKVSQSVRAPRANEPTPRITDLQAGSPLIGNQPMSRPEMGNQNTVGGQEPAADRDPEICESCEEEPVRYKMEPCGHLLCGDCIPRKKAKKKLCGMCGEEAVEVVELR